MTDFYSSCLGLWAIYCLIRIIRDSPLRILHLADHMGYAGNMPHGMTTYLLTVLPRMIGYGNQVHACYLGARHAAANLLEKEGIATTFLNTGKFDVRVLSRVWNAINAIRPDVISATQIRATTVARLIAARRRSPALVLHLHNFDKVPAPLRVLNRWLPQPAAVRCVSRAVMQTARTQFGLNPAITSVMHNPFDPVSFERDHSDSPIELRTELGVGPRVPLLTTVTRFHPEKENHRLILALKVILQHYPDAVAVFVGDGPLRSACEDHARRLGLSANMRFLGYRQDVANILRQSAVMCMTSQAEPFGYAALEALAVGTPVVGFAGGGLPEIVNRDVGGLLAAPGDDVGFARCILQVLGNPELRKKLSDAALRRASHFSPDEHVRSLLAMYAGAIADNSSRARHGVEPRGPSSRYD